MQNPLSHTMDDQEAIKERLERYLQHYAPERVKDIDTLLKRNRGREAQIFRKLVKEYGPEANIADVKPPSAARARSRSRSRSASPPHSIHTPPASSLSYAKEASTSPSTDPGTSGSLSQHQHQHKHQHQPPHGRRKTNLNESTSDFGALQSPPKSKFKSKRKASAKVDQDEDVKQSTTFEVLEGSKLRSSYFAAICKKPEVKEAKFVCGWLFRNWMMIKKWKMQYYVLDFYHKKFLEFENETDTEPRNVMSMTSARVSKETETFETPHGEIHCWDIFFRDPSPGKPPKIFKLGVTNEADLAKWRAHLNEALGPAHPPSKDVTEVVDMTFEPSNEIHTNVKSTPAARELEVIVDGKTFTIGCSTDSTNAWLLSEAIRVSDTAKNLSGLYNRTRQRMVNLAEDVDASIGPKDVVEAIDLDNKFKWRTASKLQRWYRRRRSDAETETETETDTDRNVEVGLGAMGHGPRTVTCRDLVQEFRSCLQTDFPHHFLGARVEMVEAVSAQLDALDAAFDPRVPYWPAESWTRCIMRNHVRLFYHCSERAVLGMTAIPCISSMVFDCLLNVHGQNQWDPHLESIRILESSSNGDVVVTTRSTPGMPVPLSMPMKRQFCSVRTWRAFSDESYILIASHCEHPCCPVPSSNTVVGEAREAFLIRPIGDQLGSLLFHLSLTDAKPLFQLGLLNSYFQTALVENLAGIRSAVSCR